MKTSTRFRIGRIVEWILFLFLTPLQDFKAEKKIVIVVNVNEHTPLRKALDLSQEWFHITESTHLSLVFILLIYRYTIEGVNVYTERPDIGGIRTAYLAGQKYPEL